MIQTFKCHDYVDGSLDGIEELKKQNYRFNRNLPKDGKVLCFDEFGTPEMRLSLVKTGVSNQILWLQYTRETKV